MFSGQAGLEELVSASDGVKAAIVDATWDHGVERVIEGSSDLRCKIQLAGRADYAVNGAHRTVSDESNVTFMWKSGRCLKSEHVEPNTFERSITLVFPTSEESLFGYGRDDAAVDKFFRLLDSDVLIKQFRMCATTRTIAGPLFNLDRGTRCFDKRRRSKLDELSCFVLDMFLESLVDEHRSALIARERRQICDARDLLLADLANPPPLNVLARNVGTNRTKLNEGFRTMFGMPVYQYLKRERMIAARALLEVEGRSVADVADACGFEHASNFSSAFKTFHGFSPSSICRQ